MSICLWKLDYQVKDYPLTYDFRAFKSVVEGNVFVSNKNMKKLFNPDSNLSFVS